MKYLLALQWPTSSVVGRDAMLEIEETLIENLSKDNEVDGYESGPDENTIFIYTDKPELSFNEIKSILGSNDFWVDARVAYRGNNEIEFTVLWPKDLSSFHL